MSLSTGTARAPETLRLTSTGATASVASTVTLSGADSESEEPLQEPSPSISRLTATTPPRTRVALELDGRAVILGLPVAVYNKFCTNRLPAPGKTDPRLRGDVVTSRRSEERRGGKEGVSTCRTRWAQ